MKRNNKIQVWLLFTMVAISLGISVWALIISHTDDSLTFSPSAFSDIVSLVFTVIGAVFSFYFVIIGINAHRIKKELEEIEEKLMRDQESMIEIELEQQDTMYSHLIRQAMIISDKKIREKNINSLRLSRARLATKSRLLSLETRKKRMPDLVQLGERLDIEDLKKLIKDPKEDETIKDLAIGIIPLIEERLRKENAQPHK